MTGRHVLITGASAGIGESCATLFAGAGARLTIVARRTERLERLKENLAEAHETQIEVAGLDVQDRRAVDAFTTRLTSQGNAVDVLVNNAGLSRGLAPLHEGSIQDWEEMIDTNVKGLLYMTRGILPHMVARNSGHIINLGSTAGHIVYPGGNVYNATKFAVRALTEGINLDVAGTGVRVSTVDPGLVETEFSQVRFRGDSERARKVYEGYTPLSPEDIAQVVLFVAAAPAHVNILQTVVYPTDQRSPYVLHRHDPEDDG
jgi:3-hydroxy acid dehydrogenase / malonic semialdehyde reductase